MNLPIETIRISKQGRDQLIKVRRQTGIEHWNILCRWAFCVSVKEKTAPQVDIQKLDGGVEMTWKVFAGEHSEMFATLNRVRAKEDGFQSNNEGYANCFRAHLHRGLAYLSSGKDTKSLSDFVSRWCGPT